MRLNKFVEFLNNETNSCFLLLFIYRRGGQRRAGRAAERLLAEYEHYFAAARMGMKQEDCESYYSKCDLSLYPLNDGFKKETKVSKVKKAKDTNLKKDNEIKEVKEIEKV